MAVGETVRLDACLGFDILGQSLQSRLVVLRRSAHPSQRVESRSTPTSVGRDDGERAKRTWLRVCNASCSLM